MKNSAPASVGMAKRKSDKALDVTVEASYTVGEYDIVMLSAKQSNGLETWLRENGYKMPNNQPSNKWWGKLFGKNQNSVSKQ